MLRIDIIDSNRQNSHHTHELTWYSQNRNVSCFPVSMVQFLLLLPPLLLHPLQISSLFVHLHSGGHIGGGIMLVQTTQNVSRCRFTEVWCIQLHPGCTILFISVRVTCICNQLWFHESYLSFSLHGNRRLARVRHTKGPNIYVMVVYWMLSRAYNILDSHKAHCHRISEIFWRAAQKKK